MGFETLKNLLLTVMTQECLDNYFLEHNFLDIPCFKALLSKGLGIAIIAGSLLVKVPQVVKIVKNKSGAGINLIGVFLDLLGITVHMSYSFMNSYPFSAWGDNTFLALQTAAIAALVLYFAGAKLQAGLFTLGYITLVYILNSGLTSLDLLSVLESLLVPILSVGKLTQAWTNYKNGSTGQLSAVTVFLLFAGSLARIFTSIQETGDSKIITTFCVSTLANGVIVAQLLYYWNKPAKGEKVKAAKKIKSKKVN